MEEGDPHAYDGDLDACKTACLLQPTCDGIIFMTAGRSACFFRGRIVPSQCATQSGYDLHWIAKAPSAPPQPLPPPEPPAPPLPPRFPGVCELCLSQPQCGLPPPPRWRRHESTDCRYGLGAIEVGTFPNPGSSLLRCQTACLASVPGQVLFQTPYTSYAVYGHNRQRCSAIVVPKDPHATTCYLRDEVRISQCTASDTMDVYLLEDAGEPDAVGSWGVGSIPSIEPPQHYPAASGRAWFECHLLENGGTDDFPSLNGFFRSMDELQASPWYGYFDAVYGASTLTFPINLGSLFYFHRRHLPSIAWDGLNLLPQNNWLVSKPSEIHFGDVFVGHYVLNSGDLWRAYRQLNSNCHSRVAGACLSLETVMSRGAPDNALVEVTHMCCDSVSRIRSSACDST